jgi:hypothetical protein
LHANKQHQKKLCIKMPQKTPLEIMEFFCGYKITNHLFSTDLFSSQYIAVEDCFSTPHTQPTTIIFFTAEYKMASTFPLINLACIVARETFRGGNFNIHNNYRKICFYIKSKYYF